MLFCHPSHDIGGRHRHAVDRTRDGETYGWQGLLRLGRRFGRTVFARLAAIDGGCGSIDYFFGTFFTRLAAGSGCGRGHVSVIGPPAAVVVARSAGMMSVPLMTVLVRMVGVPLMTVRMMTTFPGLVSLVRLGLGGLVSLAVVGFGGLVILGAFAVVMHVIVHVRHVVVVCSAPPIIVVVIERVVVVVFQNDIYNVIVERNVLANVRMIVVIVIAAPMIAVVMRMIVVHVSGLGRLAVFALAALAVPRRFVGLAAVVMRVVAVMVQVRMVHSLAALFRFARFGIEVPRRRCHWVVAVVVVWSIDIGRGIAFECCR